MSVEKDNLRAPFRIVAVGAGLAVIESVLSLNYIEEIQQSSPLQLEVSQGILMINLVIGLVISAVLAVYIYYIHKNTIRKDSFLYLLIGGLFGLLLGGMISHLLTVIGSFIGYRRAKE